MEYRDRTDVFDPESYDGWEPVLLEERVENPPDHRTPEYFTPEYEHARPIPSLEVEQLLRRNLIFQPLDDERGVYAIQRGRVAMKTVLDRAERPLRHKTLTPYELFRALNKGDNKNWGKDLFDLDLVVLRLNGDDPLRKKNGQPIDYWMQIEMLVASRIMRHNLPTWIMTVWHYGVHQFRAAYSRGSRDLSQSLETNFQDVRFGEVRAPAGSLNPNELLINPRTGESRMPASGLLSPPIRGFQLSEESTQAANHEGTSHGRHSGLACEDDTHDDPVTREYLASGGVLLRSGGIRGSRPLGGV
jgi:hypothetical protein